MMNMQIPKDKWKDLKVEILNTWDELTADDIEETHGSVKSIYGLVAQKCELHQEEVKAQLVSLLKKYEAPAKLRRAL